jgi:cell pole-organizing protein PopZ
MNKAAPKEPSMDEILSSIRQIIADDDAAVAPRMPIQAAPTPAPQAQTVAPDDFDLDDLPSFKPSGEAGMRFPVVPHPPKAETPKMTAESKNSLADVLSTLSSAVQKAAPPQPAAEPELEVEDEPFALSPAQIVTSDDEEKEDEPAPEAFSFASIIADEEDDEEEDEAPALPLIDPEDVAFAPESEPPAPVLAPEPSFTPPSAARAAESASMPDPTLSSDIAEQLIEPATSAAVRHTFSKLSGLNLSNQGMTIENMLADMLRPMLKEWLDENLPSVVERMVEKEISRISRGLD